MSTISKFPVTTWQRIINKRGSRAANCVVSDRWLRFGKLGPTSSGYLPGGKVATPVTVDVLTGGYDDEPRKLCTLTLTYEGLKAAVDRLTAEINDRPKAG